MLDLERFVGGRLAVRKRAVVALLALHHIGLWHVQSAVQARMHGTGCERGVAWLRRRRCRLIFALVQAASAPQPNCKQERQ